MGFLNHALSDVPVVPPLKKLWAYKLPAVAPDCCIATGGGRVVIASADRPLTCLDPADGRVLWTKDDSRPSLVKWVAGRFFVEGDAGWCEVRPDGKAGKFQPFTGIWEAGDSLIGTGTGVFVSSSDLRPVLRTEQEHDIVFTIGRVGVGFPRGIAARDLKTGKMIWHDKPAGRILPSKDVWKGKLLYQEVRRHETGPGKEFVTSQKLVCRDASTGRVEWAVPVQMGEHDAYFWIVEGEPDRVYTTHPSGAPGERRRDELRLSCHDFSTGVEISAETLCVPGPQIREFALGEAGLDHWSARAVALSPGIAWIELRYFVGSPQKKFLIAIDHGTGRLLWKEKLPQMSYLGHVMDSRILMIQERSIVCYGSKPARKPKRP